MANCYVATESVGNMNAGYKKPAKLMLTVLLMRLVFGAAVESAQILQILLDAHLLLMSDLDHHSHSHDIEQYY